jgi:hypothetical protein
MPAAATLIVTGKQYCLNAQRRCCIKIRKVIVDEHNFRWRYASFLQQVLKDSSNRLANSNVVANEKATDEFSQRPERQGQTLRICASS